MNRFLLSMVLLVSFAMPVFGQAKPTKLTVAVRGVHCEECTARLREAMGTVKGIKFDPMEIKTGGEGATTEWVALEIADLEKTDLGAVAKVVAEAKTPHRKEFPPVLFFLPFKKFDTSNEGIKLALAEVKGIDLKRTFNGDAAIWVALDGSGKAKLAEIMKGFADRAIMVTLERPKDD